MLFTTPKIIIVIIRPVAVSVRTSQCKVCRHLQVQVVGEILLHIFNVMDNHGLINRANILPSGHKSLE